MYKNPSIRFFSSPDGPEIRIFPSVRSSLGLVHLTHLKDATEGFSGEAVGQDPRDFGAITTRLARQAGQAAELSRFLKKGFYFKNAKKIFFF